MADFNQFADELADLVAAKVVALLEKQQGSDWPAVEKKDVKYNFEQPADIVEVAGGPTEDDIVVEEADDNNVVEDPKEFVRTVDKLKIANDPKDKRREELSKVNVRTLRNRAAAVGAANDVHDPEGYVGFEKGELVELLVDFEVLAGKTIDEMLGNPVAKSEPVATEPEEVADDTDLGETELPDEEEETPLTREGALGLDLATLKSIAIDNDIEVSKLKGLDVEAIVDLLYGAEESEVAEEAAPEVTPEPEPESDSDEGEGWTLEEIQGASIGQLKELAAQLEEQGAVVEFDRNTAREDLAAKIISILS